MEKIDESEIINIDEMINRARTLLYNVCNPHYIVNEQDYHTLLISRFIILSESILIKTIKREEDENNHNRIIEKTAVYFDPTNKSYLDIMKNIINSIESDGHEIIAPDITIVSPGNTLSDEEKKILAKFHKIRDTIAHCQYTHFKDDKGNGIGIVLNNTKLRTRVEGLQESEQFIYRVEGKLKYELLEQFVFNQKTNEWKYLKNRDNYKFFQEYYDAQAYYEANKESFSEDDINRIEELFNEIKRLLTQEAQREKIEKLLEQMYKISGFDVHRFSTDWKNVADFDYPRESLALYNYMNTFFSGKWDNIISGFNIDNPDPTHKAYNVLLGLDINGLDISLKTYDTVRPLVDLTDDFISELDLLINTGNSNDIASCIENFSQNVQRPIVKINGTIVRNIRNSTEHGGIHPTSVKDYVVFDDMKNRHPNENDNQKKFECKGKIKSFANTISSLNKENVEILGIDKTFSTIITILDAINDSNFINDVSYMNVPQDKHILYLKSRLITVLNKLINMITITDEENEYHQESHDKTH